MPALFRHTAAKWLLLVVPYVLVLTGCQGCRFDSIVQRKKKSLDIDELEKKKKEQQKEDFEFQPLRVLPDVTQDARAFVKPGHWITLRNLVRANNFDFQAELFTSASDSAGRPLRIPNTEFRMTTSWPAPLPKGQEKVFDTNYLVPVLPQTVDDMQPKSVWLTRDLRAARGGRLIKEDVRQGTVVMPAYQYYFVALLSEPDRYAYLKSLPSFAAFTGPENETEKLVYYRVVAPSLDRVAPVPNHALTWTSIAYVLWDDVSPTVLTSFQQQALVDWLHWGGQLVISGPNSLEKLRGSYLEPYLPAVPVKSVPMDRADLEEINRFWSLRDSAGQLQTWNLPTDNPPLIVELGLQEGAQYVPHCGHMVAERRVGAGRTVVTAFRLSDSRWLSWKCLDNFMNGAILRRPSRDYRLVDQMPDTYWSGYHPSRATDARFISTLRYFSRDMGHFSTAPEWNPSSRDAVREADTPNPGAPASPYPVPTNRGRTDVPFGAGGGGFRKQVPEVAAASVTGTQQHDAFRDAEAHDWHFRGFSPQPTSGMCGWSDRNGPSDVARESLKDASGISVPKGDFVLKVLVIYLAVLAPLNWLVFRAISRVEWAWVAAPVIAMIGTFAVVRLAQLDIGFARSMTELAIAEMQGNYSRAHVTRYAAMYTSLSTSYELEFEDDGSLAQPFATTTEAANPQLLRSTPHEVALRREKRLKLDGLVVNSNTEGFVHSEQISDMGGGFSLAGQSDVELRLHNGTRHTLQSVGILRRTPQGRLETAWVGDLRANGTVPLRFSASQEQHLPQWDDSLVTSSYHRQARWLLTSLDADDNEHLSRGEVESHTELKDQFLRLDSNTDRRLDQGEIMGWSRQLREGELSLGGLLELAAQALVLLPGDVRLVGWTAEPIPGVSIRPAASQELRRTLFVVHLVSGALPAPQSDRRMPFEMLEVQPENADISAEITEP